MAYKQTGDELGNNGLQSAHCASRMAYPSQIRLQKKMSATMLRQVKPTENSMSGMHTCLPCSI